MVGIIATLPQAFVQEWVSRVTESNGGLIMISIEILVWIAIILASVMLVMAVRKIAVQYARRNASGGFDRNVAGSRQYIPLRLNASGVMPIIFAQALMFVPSYIGSAINTTSTGQWIQTNFSDIFGLWYNILFAILVILSVDEAPYEFHVIADEDTVTALFDIFCTPSRNERANRWYCSRISDHVSRSMPHSCFEVP